MTAAIRVHNLSKRYRLVARTNSVRELVNSTAGRLFARITGRTPPDVPLQAIRDHTPHGTDFWALRDVSFDIRPGEIVGIIGRNGAGKSTLLKVLSRIVAPTSGRVDLSSRVASLLEVGTGFHPELTGRENVYLNGAILGMTKSEIRRKFDEIVAFAEVDQFIDTPVKRYSSGMYVRLAFAVAAHLEPEILIVDEVLAVGDASFQRKCLSKIGDVGRGGRTVLFVTHNMLAIRSLCHRAILLEKGQIALDSDPESATFAYLKTASSECWEQVYAPDDERACSNGVRLHAARIRPEAGPDASQLTVDTPFCVEFDWEHNIPDRVLNLSLQVDTPDGICVFNTFTPPQAYETGRYVTQCNIPGGLLNDGTYHLSLMIVLDTSRLLISIERFGTVEVRDKPREWAWLGKWPGIVRPGLTWTSVPSCQSEDSLVPMH